MSKGKIEEFDPQLELKDRLNYTHILSTSIIAMKRSLRESNQLSMKKVQIMILDLLTDIPDTWKDEQLEQELKTVLKTKIVDIRPVNAGVKLSVEACKRRGIPIRKKVKEINYFRLKNALINLLDRRHLLIQKEKIEYSTGKNLEMTLEDLEEAEAEFEAEDEE